MEPLLGLAQGEFFLVVLFVALPIAAIAFASAGKVYDEIGKGAFAMDHQDHEGGGEYGGIGSSAAAQAEIRQMVEAKSYRRVARGLEPLDVDAEIARLMTPTSPPINDPELVEEVRQMVEAKNARRTRRGEQPLDVEAELQRRLTELGGAGPGPAANPIGPTRRGEPNE